MSIGKSDSERVKDNNTEIHFLSVSKSHTYALTKDTKHLRLDGRVCLYRRLFSDTIKPWGAKLILTAELAFPVSCASTGHLLMAQHCPLCLNVCFNPLHQSVLFAKMLNLMSAKCITPTLWDYTIGIV